MIENKINLPPKAVLSLIEPKLNIEISASGCPETDLISPEIDKTRYRCILYHGNIQHNLQSQIDYVLWQALSYHRS